MLVDFVVVVVAVAAVAVMNESKLWYRYSRTNAPRVVVMTNIVSAAAVGEGFDSDDVTFSFSVDFIFSGVESGELGNGD